MLTKMNTLYETVKTYGKGKGEDMMWKTVALISDAVELEMTEESRRALLADIYGLMSGGHYNEEFAMACVAKMYFVDKAGNKHHAPYWSTDQVREVYTMAKGNIPQQYNFWDFFVTFNMVASDNWLLYHEWWPDMTEAMARQKFGEAAVNWLNDQDWKSDSKIWDYLHKD